MDPVNLDDSTRGVYRSLHYAYSGETAMTLPLFSRVILTQDIREHELVAGDMGTIVEHHPATSEYPEGYEVECFAGNGDTIAVVSVPVTGLRQATSHDVMHVRPLTSAAS